MENTEPKSERHLIGWLLFPISLFPAVALKTYNWQAVQHGTPLVKSSNTIGPIGDWFAYHAYNLFGLAAWVIPILFIAFGVRLVLGSSLRPGRRTIWSLVFLLASATLVELQADAPGLELMRQSVNCTKAGGIIGWLFGDCILLPLLAKTGSSVIILILMAIALSGSVGLMNIAHFFSGLIEWARGDGSDTGRRAGAEADEDDSARTSYEAARAAKEEAKRLREEDRRRMREEKLAEKAAKAAALEAARAADREAKEAAKAAALKAKEEARLAKEAAQQLKIEQTRLENQAHDDLLKRVAAARAAARADQSVQTAPARPAEPVAAAVVTRPEPVRPEPVVRPAPVQAEPPVVAKVEKSAPEPVVEADEEETKDKGPYELPPVSLLAPLKASSADHSDVGEMSQRLIDTLKLFGIDATLSKTIQGPVVTKYALLLAPGTRYSAVTNLQDNLKGALRAKSLRIEAPIPGDECIGIEVPNKKPAGISFREIFESDAWKNANAELPLLFGKRADGRELVADLASMPHMLVAGATGQGKSVCLNSLINGLLMTRTPEQMKLIMVDPKCVEFTPYSSIPHLLVPVITDNRKVVFSLHWAVAEMEKRLKMFARARVRNIYDFNHRKPLKQADLFGGDAETASDMPKTVPYIVIIIDEAADLIGQCGKEVNPDIQRITQKARAAGIHLILATQRPEAKIITGAIKANIPGRVAFKTASSVDSRTILDDTGAENLIGKGDMLFKGKDGLLIRAQGAWISDDEIANVTGFIAEHSNVEFDEKFALKLGRVKEAAVEDPFASNEDDPDNQQPAEPADAPSPRELVKAAANADDFKKAVECVINTKRASTSHFQRQMGWGYNHAAKILDMLTERGIVSAPQGMGPRQIIMDQDQLVAILNGDENGAANVAENLSAQPAETNPAEEPAFEEESNTEVQA